MTIQLTKKSAEFLAPGRGVLESKAVKLPKPNKAFEPLCEAYAGVQAAHEALEGEPGAVEAAQAARAALLRGEPGAFEPVEASLVWRLLTDVWASAYNGTPAGVTRGRQVAPKIARYWLSAGGAVGAVEALYHALQWEPAVGAKIARFDPPRHPPFEWDAGYQLRLSAVHVLLRELRLGLAHVNESDYEAAAAVVARLREGLPLHLQVALGFLVPTEQALARDCLAQLAPMKTYQPLGWPGRSTWSEQDLSYQWPSWAIELAWSLREPQDFAPLLERDLVGGWHTAQLLIAVWAQAPEALPDRYLRYPLLYDKYAEDV